jgi:hypothetical protein
MEPVMPSQTPSGVSARLTSEDTDCPTGLVLQLVGDRTLPAKDGETQRWQLLSIELLSGKRSVNTLPGEEVLICRQPTDEIAQLAEHLQRFLDNERTEVLFEPSEPTFEMSFARGKRTGIHVEIWIDSGNGTTGIYTWDACGLRFMTTEENLKAFVDQLHAWSQG